ncbi:hypothetical protein [Oleiharenicola lentus]|uniref:hypothetical protein n=1 Tax=Oleiharenicola lentus TaxID=2508720 RepID=UPI003F66A8CC
MKRVGLAAPFVLLAVLSIASRWFPNGSFLGNVWFLAFLGCILLVPVLSRLCVWLGYIALFYPFILLGLIVALDWGNLSIGWN